MEVEGKTKSIRFRLFGILCATIILIIIVIILINSKLLESFLTYSKINVAKKIRSEVNDYYNSVFAYNINSELRNIEIKNDMKILIISDQNEIVYYGDKDLVTYIMRVLNNLNEKTIYSDSDSMISKIEEANNQSLILVSTLDNGYLIYIRIPITPIKESVRISNETLVLIGCV